uniref:Uncharacterized protein n=1 Tax=Anguilla anguilla TaxID=7936 RepID=A0A0E9PW05_ANGAN
MYGFLYVLIATTLSHITSNTQDRTLTQ